MRNGVSGLRVLLPYLMVAVVTVVVYAQAPTLPYVWDDRTMLVNDPRAADGLNLGEVLERDPYAVGRQFSRPLSALLLIPESQLGQDGPVLGHSLSLALHLAVSLLLLAELLAFGVSAQGAALLALGFAVHPLNSEAVYWVSARGDLLVGLAVLLAWRVGRTMVSPPRAAWTLALLSLAALAAKESGTLVVGVGLGSMWSHRRGLTDKALATGKALATVGAGQIAALLAYFAWRSATGVALLGRADELAYSAVAQQWLFEIGQIFVWLTPPVNSSVAHARVTPSVTALLFAAGATVSLGWLSVRHARIRGDRRPLALIALFFLSLGPVALAALVTGIESERYAYVPSLCLGLGLVLLVQPAVTHLSGRSLLWPRLATGVAAVAIVGLGVVTYVRGDAWSSEGALFRQAYAADPTSSEAARLLAHELAYHDQRLDLALPLLEQRVAARPDDAAAWTNLSACLIDAGRYGEAVSAAQKALALDPLKVSAERNLAKAKALGGVDSKTGGPAVPPESNGRLRGSGGVR